MTASHRPRTRGTGDRRLLRLGVFEWELQLQSDSLFRTVFPRQGGRKRKKSLSHCQKIFNVSQRSVASNSGLRAKRACISLDWREPSDPMPLPGPQTEMQKTSAFPVGLENAVRGQNPERSYIWKMCPTVGATESLQSLCPPLMFPESSAVFMYLHGTNTTPHILAPTLQ